MVFLIGQYGEIRNNTVLGTTKSFFNNFDVEMFWSKMNKIDQICLIANQTDSLIQFYVRIILLYRMKKPGITLEVDKISQNV